jgi:ATP-dependent exoDNAse (exonuclease V) beta subunit
MNAVKVMTIHAAKGLQFPIVFLPSLDEDNAPRSSSIVIEEDGQKISFAYEEDSLKRKKVLHFQKRREKELEEEKRLFYVAVTRARDFLCMLGAPKKNKQHTGRLAYMTGNLEHLSSLVVLHEPDIDRLYSSSRPVTDTTCSSPDFFFSGPIYSEPLSYEPALRWRDVTEDLDIRVKHGEDWVLLGRVFHSLFEELSRGTLKPDEIEKKAFVLFRNDMFTSKEMKRLIDTVKEDFKKLDLSGYLRDVILPQVNSYTELPFILRKGNTVFRGRIDRIIIKDETAVIYDYKTFPVRERELPELIEKYRFQMEIYRAASEQIFSLKSKGYLLFTHAPLLIEV